MDNWQKNYKTERARRLGRKKTTRQDTGKGNQMTALRFLTGGRRQTAPTFRAFARMKMPHGKMFSSLPIMVMSRNKSRRKH